MTIEQHAPEHTEQIPAGEPTGGEETVPTPERQPKERPRIYVASLSDYNDGILHGVWINADQEADELYGAVEAMLEESEQPWAEEWAIHDYEGFGPLHLSEYESLDTISRVALGITEHGLAFAAWASLSGDEVETHRRFDEAYRGHWPSAVDYAEELLDDLGASEILANVP